MIVLSSKINTLNKGSKMRLISWNVNGIRAAVKKGFLDYLADEEPDILCIQESKAHKEQLTSEILKDH